MLNNTSHIRNCSATSYEQTSFVQDMIKTFRFVLLLSAMVILVGQLRAQAYTGSSIQNDSVSVLWDQYLDELVVTATRTPKTLSRSPILTRLIGELEIKSNSYENVTEVLEYNLPGLSFKKDGRGINMQVQGLENDYILVLIDGEQLTSTAGGNIDLGRISQSNIKQIEIVKGASSLLYGSNAIGMVINIITKKPVREFEGSCMLQYGKFQNALVDLIVGGKKGAWSGRTSMFYNSTKGYNLNPENQQIYTVNPYSNYSINQNVWWEKRATVVSGGITYFLQNQYNPPLSIKDDRYRNSNLTVNIKGEHQIDSHQLRLSYFADHYIRYPIIADEVKSANTKSAQHSIRFIDDYNPTEDLEVVSGAEANFNNYYSDTKFGKENNHRHIYDLNVFTQGDYQLHPEINVTGGARYTYHSAFGGAFTPKINLMYSPHNFKFRLGYSYGFKAPDATELYSDFMMGTVSHNIGNPDLNAERSQYGYCSLEYRKRAFAISGEIYQNSIRDKIQHNFVRVVDHDGNKWTELRYKNIGQVRIRGAQLIIDAYPCPFLMLRANYSYTDAVNMDNHLQLSGNAKHAINGSLSFRGNIFRMNSALSLSGRWTSEKINDLERQITNKETGMTDVMIEHNPQKAYSMWKLSGQITPFEKGDMSITLSLGIQNLFNFTDPINFTTFDPGRRVHGKVIFNF